jgi:hypothetical protein
MAGDPTEIPQTNPGSPTEPPQESPPGNPNPEIPPPIDEPGAPPQPQELPGRAPDEMPTRGPSGPSVPNPATDDSDIGDGGLGNGIDSPGSEPDVHPPVQEPPSM